MPPGKKPGPASVFPTETLTQNQTLSRNISVNLANAHVAEWEQISAARFQNLVKRQKPEGGRLFVEAD